jgi:hypothetical protein
LAAFWCFGRNLVKYLSESHEKLSRAKGPAALVLHRSGPTSPLHLSLSVEGSDIHIMMHFIKAIPSFKKKEPKGKSKKLHNKHFV